MSELVIEVEAAQRSMEELRDALDAAFHRQFPGGLLQRKWAGEVLEVSGPGASGSIVLTDGRLVGRAELKPPASMMRGVIEQKVRAALEEAVGAAAS